MAKKSFRTDVRPLFAKYVQDMAAIRISDGEGTPTLQLGNYESVKRFHLRIKLTIEGYNAGAKPTPHPMPPPPTAHQWQGPLPRDVNRLPQEAIDIFNQWIEDGMQP